MRIHISIGRLGLAGALLAALAGCALGPAQPPASPAPASGSPATASSTAPPAGQEPTAAVTPRTVETNGVRLTIPFADSDIQASLMPEANDPNAPWFSRMPAHTRISFKPFLDGAFGGQTLFAQPEILIIPTADFAKFDFAGQQDTLQALIRSKLDLAIETELPYLPPNGAAQVLHAQERTFAFANGSGIRYLTRYAQDASPLTGKDLFYTFQGVTDDGKYYVAATFPVLTTALPASLGDPDRSAATANFESYLMTTVGLINQADAERDFTPPLAQLDALIASLSVQAP